MNTKNSVLVIDDNITNINTLNTMLKDEYTVYVAKNGLDGIHQAKAIKPSMILLDILMPEMDGFAVLNALREQDETRNIPVMIISSLSDGQNEEKGLKLGAVDYITKPFNPNIIKAKIKNHIELFTYRKYYENYAMFDGLTGIPNRRSYDVFIKKDWGYSVEHKKPISMAILDIDCFKEYNDNYGHLQGDVVLKKVATVLYDCVPNHNGNIARYGGEEFVVTLRDCDKEHALPIMETMRQAVEDIKIEHLHSRAAKVITVSIGGRTIVPGESDDLVQFVESVDQRLYRAKGVGRNVIIWDDYNESQGQLEVFLLGNLKIVSKTGVLQVTRNFKRKRWLLLAFLILHRFREYTKQDLINAVWPYGEVEDEQYELKRVLEELKLELEVLKLPYLRELIITINGVYRWNNDYLCVVDVEVFEQLCSKAQRTDRSSGSLLTNYKKAVDLYQHDMLYRINTVIWVNEAQKRYRGMYVEALICCLKDRYVTADYQGIIHLCEKDFEREEYNEELHYYYLIALIKLKRNKEALEHYEYLLESYYSLMNTAPSPAITSMYLDILNPNKEVKKNLSDIIDEMKESNLPKGAYYCDYHIFKRLYQIEARNMIRTGRLVYMCLINVEEIRGIDSVPIEFEEVMSQLLSCIKHNLRVGDAITRRGVNQYLILLPLVNYESGNMVIKRFLRAFHEEYSYSLIRISYELIPVSAADKILL